MVIGTWYGMNFKTMPELEHGYYYALGSMLVTTTIMVFYLKKKRWF
jgi:magnesium transporter